MVAGAGQQAVGRIVAGSVGYWREKREKRGRCKYRTAQMGSVEMHAPGPRLPRIFIPEGRGGAGRRWPIRNWGRVLRGRRRGGDPDRAGRDWQPSEGLLPSARGCPHPGGLRLGVPGEEEGLKTRRTPTDCQGVKKPPTSSKSRKKRFRSVREILWGWRVPVAL